MEKMSLQGFRLSPQQQHLWRLQSGQGGEAFVVQCSVEIEGALDRKRLRRALERAVERHEILRTTFPLLPGVSLPVQVVHETGAVEITERSVAGIAGMAGDEWDTMRERLLEAERTSPFDLAEGPLVRAALCEVGPARHALLLTLPALAADAASLRSLAGELARSYAGAEEGEEPLQYADATEALHEWLGPVEGEAGLAYWQRQELSGLAGSAIEGPYAPQTVSLRLGHDRTEAVERLAASLDASLPQLLLACWQATLRLATGEEDILVGVVFDGRAVLEFAGALGPYSRSLPIRSGVGARSTLRDLVAALGGKVAEAAEWQLFFSPERVERWTFGFACEETCIPLDGQGFTLHVGYAGSDRCDLRLSARTGGGSIALDLSFDPLVWDPERAETLLGRFLRVLDGACADPALPLVEIDVLSEAERRELLVEWNRTARPLSGVLAHERFEESARSNPSETAVIAERFRLTYEELNARANRLAHQLKALGAAPGVLVGLCLERSPEMVEAVLAVLKTGAAYVPLDPAYPAERLAFMAADAALPLLVTREEMLARQPALGGIPCIVRLDEGGEDRRVMARRRAEDPERSAGPDDLAYLIYTSGSTGRPKGVMVTHRGLANYLGWATESYRAGQGGGAPVHSAIGFDLTVTSLLAPLVAGAPAVLLPEEEGAAALAAALRAGGDFSLVKLTPAHLQVLRQLLPPEELAGRARALVIGGEALWAESLAPWREHAPGTRLINEYGPTEATVGCCVYEVRPGDPAAGAVPIGRPIANTRLYVVGPGLRPVPPGVAGELWIGGAGLARGYLGRPYLTAERFVPDPFAGCGEGQPGDRLYRTGDLVRLRPDDELEFLGRIDSQVKIRGFRIEPAEIEMALAAHPLVAEAAVVPRPADGGLRLVAYVVPADPEGGRELAAELRSFLASRLPEPMIPAAFVALAALPLTPNGKLDRHGLPELQGTGHAAEYAAPRNLVEEVLAQIWARVLDVDRVGIDDNFFDLGGDSIRTVQISPLARKRGIELNVQDIFSHPTIRELAGQVALAGADESAPLPAEPFALPFTLLAEADLRRLPPGLEDAYPLTQLQAGMLFHSELDPESAVYHDLHSFRLRTRYDADLLAAVIGQVTRRHPVLRTSFALSGFTEPLQLVHAEVAPPIVCEDLRHLSAEEGSAAVAAWLDDEAHRHFDWTRPPLVRFHTHRLEDAVFQLTLSFHHSVLDGWSAATLLTDLFRRYKALLNGEAPAAEPALASTFREYVESERRTLESAEARDFWRRLLAGAEPAALPRRTTPPRGATGTFTVDASPPAEVADRLRRLARSAAVPFKSVLLAAHVRVLSYLTGNPDPVTGVVSHGRPERSDGEQVLGLFLNTLPFRLRLSSTWADLAQEAFDLERRSLPFRRFPLAELQREHGGAPLFEAVFNFLHYHVYRGAAGASGIEMLESFGYEETNFPLSAQFQIEPGTSRLALTLGCRTADLDVADAEAFGRAYQAALAAMAADPAGRWDAIPLLPEAERRQILEELGDGGRAAAPVSCIHELIDREASLDPGRTALVWEGGRMSLGELNSRASRLAHHLRSLGVRAETRVGFCLERSPEMLVALLGVLQSGAAYVPLDPGHPSDRLRFLIEDAGLSVLITREQLVPRLPISEEGIRIVRVDADREAIERQDSRPPLPVASPGNLAYVIYTSGSTGRPKGVMVPHAGLANLAHAQIGLFGIKAGDRVLQFAPPTFDASVPEILTALLAGAELHLAEADRLLPGPDLLALLRDRRITHVTIPPSILAVLPTEGPIDGLADLAALVLAGEACPPDLPKRWSRPGRRLINAYGPTEVTVCGTIGAIDPAGEGRPSIGRPIPGMRALVLDRDLTPVPVGVPQELCLTGPGLARGYLGRPDLTAERFVPDPFGEAGGRLYRTGDLARWRSDGTLDFLGRVDHQIKVRGFRIEPGEIETVLAAQPGVRQAVVLLREDSASERRLVAYVVPEAGSEASVSDLRRALAERLPDYMVPAFFVLLDALPLNPHGKLDRARLPPPDAGNPARGTAYVTPRGPVEEALAAIWAEVLRVERVGAEDDFFELGGDSILSLQISMQARQAGLGVSPRLLFRHPTLAGLAAAVATDTHLAPEVEPEVEPGPVPLTPIQRWFFAGNPADPHWFNQAVLLATERLAPARLAAALERIESRHDALRLRFASGPEGWSQTVTVAGDAPLTVVDLSFLPEARHPEAVTDACAGAQQSFDLAQGPLHRALLLDLGPGRPGRLFWAAHHLAVDGVSWRILLDELAASYAGSSLPPRTSSFSRWARRLAEHAASAELREELAWWHDQPWDQAPPLPADLPAEDRDGAASELAVTLRLDPHETVVLLREVPRIFGARIQEAFLTALVRAFQQWTGVPVLHLDLEGHGRGELFPDHDLSRTVGWLTALYPVLLDLREAPDLAAALRAVRDQLRRVPRGGLGHGLLRWLTGDEGLATLSPPQVIFNYLGQLDQALPGSSPFSAAGEAMGRPSSPRATRRHQLEWNGGVVDGSLAFTLTGSAVFRRETLERLAASVVRELRDLVARATWSEETYPLTPLQEGMVFLSLYSSQAETYAWQLSCRLVGPLDHAAFRRAWERVIERHEILRTRFVWEGLSRPLQVVARRAELPLHVADWSALPAAAQRASLEDLLEGDLRRPFDLGRAPLMRLILVREGAESHRLVWSTQMMLMDGWSMHRIVREAFLLYDSLALGRPEPEVGTPRPFRDHVDWLTGREASDAEIFWRRELAGFAAATPLPGDRGEAGRKGEPGKAQHRRPLSAPATEALQELARSLRLTLNTLVQGAWVLLLARAGGGQRVVFGATVSGRPAELSGADSMVGLFINTLPVHARVDPDAPLSAWLRGLQDHHSEARQYEHLALPEIQGWSDVPRGQPLFDSLIVFENYPVERSVREMGGSLRIEEVRLLDFVNYPLTLVAAPGEQLSLHLDYDRSRLPAGEAALQLGRLETLLAAMVANPEAPLAELLGPGAAERHQILSEWNDSAAGGVPDLYAHQLIARGAERHPEAIAVSLGEERLTYGDLDRRATDLARWLIAEGVRPDSVIPIVSERDPGFLISVLAVFKAGAAYLPLEPFQPPLRLIQLIEASGARLVLAARGFVPGLARDLAARATEGGPRVLTREDLLAREAPAVELPQPSPRNGLAYVIFTSGSTGLPKGAMVEHRGMLNHLWAKVTALGLSRDDVVAQTASQGFDISVWQFLAALLVSGRVEIFPDDVAHDPLRLAGEVERRGVTVVETVPSLLRLMLDELESRPAGRPGLARLRWMIPTGEALPPDLCRRWLALYPEVPLLNAYGPTECSDDVTHHPVRRAADALEARVPIGRPVPRLRLYVLGGDLRPVAAGVPGELFVGGAGLGRGYLADGGRTAEAWVPDPLAADGPGSRLYRTGDLARHRADGALEFLGRIDHQVKVRGHRIELGEIEAVLASYPSVRHAAVLAREDVPGERRLVAYVVPRTGDGTGALDSSKVEQWESVFDEVYSQEEAASTRDAGVNLRVWVSSYSGDPLPEDEILECVDDSAGRILDLRPRRLLEIGCGTGLLLLRIAPSCSSYWGTDVSAEVLSGLDRRLAGRSGLPPVELRHRAADDFDGIPRETFDTVVLNEVAQYFPSVDYLVRVIEGAVAAAAPGGVVFVGGLRSLPLLDAFHSSVALWRAPDALSTAELREEAHRRRAQEKELVVDPELLSTLAGCLPRVRGVSLQLKGGRSRNELTRFRYDAVLWIKGAEEGQPVASPASLEWQELGTLEALRERLAGCGPETPVLEVRGLPNARLQEELAVVRLLRDGGPATAGELRAALHANPPEAGIDPADLWDLGRELGWEAQVRWSEAGGEGLIDASFARPGARPRPVSAARPEPASWSRFANDPLRGVVAENLVPELRSYAAARLPDPMLPAAYVLLDALPLTPNGKLDRKSLPAPDQVRPELEASYAAPLTAVEKELAGIWEQVLRIDRVGVHDNFFELGGDSILSIQVVSRANRAGLRVTPRQMFQHPTISELAAVAGTTAGTIAEQAPVVGPVPLTPIQHWFFERDFLEPQRWNLPVLLEVREPIPPAVLAAAWGEMLVHHDALRLRFAPGAAGWRQTGTPPDGPLPFVHLDLAALPAERRRQALGEAADQVQGSLDLERGPVVRAALFNLVTGLPARLLLAAHHLVIDGVSWRILLEDLEAACRALARGERPVLPLKTLSFRAWAERLAQHAHSPAVAAEASYWGAEERSRVAPLPVDFPGGANTWSSARTLSVSLDELETQALLQEVPRAYNTRIDDALLTALAQALAGWTGRRSVLVELEGHGREELSGEDEIDLSRTVGWFTAEYPVLLEATGSDPGERLKAVKEQLRAIPGKGIGYGLLRYLGEPEVASRLAALPAASVLFNYLGQLDQTFEPEVLFALASEPAGSSQSPRERRSRLLEVNAWIADGRLRADWTYSESLYRSATIGEVADGFLAALRALVDHCRSPEVGGYTPSDFAAARLDQAELDNFLSRLGGGQ